MQIGWQKTTHTLSLSLNKDTVVVYQSNGYEHLLYYSLEYGFDEGIQPDYELNVEGLPLHYYLARNSNIDIDIVKLLVEAYPQSLLVPGDNVYLVEEIRY